MEEDLREETSMEGRRTRGQATEESTAADFEGELPGKEREVPGSISAEGMPELPADFFLPGGDSDRAAQYSPVVLAFIGDAAYELAVRTFLVREGSVRPKRLNIEKATLVKAEAQSAMIRYLQPALCERENEIFRRGRNTKTNSVAKNAHVTDYRRATGFEALMGYLYLSGQTDRMLELISRGLAWYTSQGPQKPTNS
ncbi:MAG: ribonuclease III domain-containing protein [Lachnospiraceae bacterium]|nr:ribonuclease III domain-containing protein [Lachnospiraceae bacterium]